MSEQLTLEEPKLLGVSFLGNGETELVELNVIKQNMTTAVLILIALEDRILHQQHTTGLCVHLSAEKGTVTHELLMLLRTFKPPSKQWKHYWWTSTDREVRYRIINKMMTKLRVYKMAMNAYRVQQQLKEKQQQ